LNRSVVKRLRSEYLAKNPDLASAGTADDVKKPKPVYEDSLRSGDQDFF
jgi:hypothetical protein